MYIIVLKKKQDSSKDELRSIATKYIGNKSKYEHIIYHIKYLFVYYIIYI